MVRSGNKYIILPINEQYCPCSSNLNPIKVIKIFWNSSWWLLNAWWSYLSVCNNSCCTSQFSATTGDPFCLLVFWNKRQADLHPAGWYVGQAAETEPQALPPWTLLEVSWVCIIENGSPPNHHQNPLTVIRKKGVWNGRKWTATGRIWFHWGEVWWSSTAIINGQLGTFLMWLLKFGNSPFCGIVWFSPLTDWSTVSCCTWSPCSWFRIPMFCFILCASISHWPLFTVISSSHKYWYL